jgi:hypothetical protein
MIRTLEAWVRPNVLHAIVLHAQAHVGVELQQVADGVLGVRVDPCDGRRDRGGGRGGGGGGQRLAAAEDEGDDALGVHDVLVHHGLCMRVFMCKNTMKKINN